MTVIRNIIVLLFALFPSTVLSQNVTVSLPSNQLIFSGNKSYSGANSVTNSWLWGYGVTLSGSATTAGDGFISPFHFYIGSDTVDTSNQGLIGLSMLHASSGGSSTGGRIAIQGYEAIVGTPTVTPAAGYVGGSFYLRGSVNLNGTSGAYSNYKGAAFGSNSNVFLTSGATYYTNVVSSEFDVTVPSTASTADKYGISIIKGSNDAKRGDYDDAAININDQDGASSGWKYGLSFGAYAHQWAFSTDSTLIGAQQRQVGPASSSVAGYGIDFSAVTFSNAPMRMPLMTPASSSDTCSSGSMKWDASYIYVCTATNTWKRATLSSF